MVKNPNDIKIHPIDFDQFMVKTPRYVIQNNEYEMYDVLMEEGALPLLLEGPAGVGKTLSIASWAEIKAIPIIQADCSENIQRNDLIGRFILQGKDRIEYELGILSTAIELANHSKRAVLVFEELNALTPGMQKVLNQLLDWRNHIFIPEINKTLKLKEDCTLFICATMNPSNYGGTHQLNEDLKSRFVVKHVDYPNGEREKEIVFSTTGLSREIIENLIKLATETRLGAEKGELDYELSPRDLILFGRLYNAFVRRRDSNPLKSALELSVIGKFETKSQKETIRIRIQSIFGAI